MTKNEEDALVNRVMETEWDERELRLAIRAAVAQERERCAKVFGETEDEYWSPLEIAAAIRRGEE